MSTKNKIIQILKGNNDFFSGEKISKELGISRAAVAKHVASLRKEGYLIDSVTNRGYLLKIAPDEIDLDMIKTNLSTKTIGTGQWLLLEQTASTNKDAILWATQNVPNGSIIIAKEQTEGKGRKGKKWFSSPRSIYFSIILRPENSKGMQLHSFSVMAVQAIQKTLLQLKGVQAHFKEPNDVMIEGKKIAGVLVEAGFVADEVDWVIIGIGCNLNNEKTEFPEDIQERVTSLFVESGEITSRNAFYHHLIKALDELYQQALN